MVKVTSKHALLSILVLSLFSKRVDGQNIPSLALETSPEAKVAERQSVSQRPRPDYDPLGVRISSFVAFPSIDVAEIYDSNVFATTTDTKKDYYTSIRPSLSLQSNWNSHALNIQTSGDIRRYRQQAGENNSNFSALVGGRLDMLRNIYFTAGAGYQILHEDRSSPNAVDGKFPIQYDVTSGNLGYVHDAGRLGLRIEASAANYNYHNGISSTGLPIVESDRNMTEFGVAARVAYEIIPGYDAFIRAVGDDRVYASKFDAGGFERSSHGYRVAAGTAVEIGPTINGEIYVGYLEQDYDDPRLKPASGIAFGGSLLWNLTRLTSVRAALARTVEETIIGSASSYLQTQATLGIEHELLRNLLLTGVLTYAVQDYQGLDRSDAIYGIDLGVRYLLNRKLSGAFDAAYNKRTSNSLGATAGADYDRALIAARIKLQF